MTLELKKNMDTYLQRIVNVLLLNANSIDNPGLINGKMGIVIFLYHCARKTGNEMYENYAGELIDEIYEEINTKTPVDFPNGLTGIGWGIEYLVKNGFVKADTDEILTEIDDVIYRDMLQRPVLIGDSNDLFGYGFYYIARLRRKESNDNNLSTLQKKQHLIYLTDECERLLILRRYLNFNISTISTGTINSIAWFLLEMNKLGLFPVKVEKLLRHLHSVIEFCPKRLDDWAENFVLWNFVQNIIPLINDNLLQQKFIVIAKSLSDRNKEIEMDDELFVNNFAAMAWQKLVYSPYIKEDLRLSQISSKTFEIIDDEENWSLRLDKLNRDNIGLNGLAGLALGLMNKEI